MAGRDRAASPIHSLLYGDPKRHTVDLKESADLAAALEMVQKVVDPDKVFGEMKLPPELQTASTTLPTAVSISADVRDNQQSAENMVHIANFTTRPLPTSTDSLPPEDSANGVEPTAKRLRTEAESLSFSSTAACSSSSTTSPPSHTEQQAAEASSASEKSVTLTPTPATPPSEHAAASDSNHVDVSVTSVSSVLASKVSPAPTPVPAEGATAESVTQ